MAKVNKSQAIRDALKANRKKSPLEIAGLLKEQGVNVTATYVSNVKFHSKGRGLRAMTVRGSARRTRKGKSAAASFYGIPSALEFIRAAGGLENAKSILRTVEEISSVV
jgi:hypothetical protein